jgi:hypothetical protein
MKNQNEIESKLEKLEIELKALESNLVSKAIDPKNWNFKRGLLIGTIGSIKWVLNKKQR